MSAETFGRPGTKYYGVPMQQVVDIKRQNRMTKVDQFDPAIRSLIHEYGLTVVDTIYSLGVTKPRQIKHIVETVLDEFSPTRGSYSNQGVRSKIDGGNR